MSNAHTRKTTCREKNAVCRSELQRAVKCPQLSAQLMLYFKGW